MGGGASATKQPSNIPEGEIEGGKKEESVIEKIEEGDDKKDEVGKKGVIEIQNGDDKKEGKGKENEEESVGNKASSISVKSNENVNVQQPSKPTEIKFSGKFKNEEKDFVLGEKFLLIGDEIKISYDDIEGFSKIESGKEESGFEIETETDKFFLVLSVEKLQMFESIFQVYLGQEEFDEEEEEGELWSHNPVVVGGKSLSLFSGRGESLSNLSLTLSKPSIIEKKPEKKSVLVGGQNISIYAGSGESLTNLEIKPSKIIPKDHKKPEKTVEKRPEIMVPSQSLTLDRLEILSKTRVESDVLEMESEHQEGYTQEDLPEQVQSITNIDQLEKQIVKSKSESISRVVSTEGFGNALMNPEHLSPRITQVPTRLHETKVRIEKVPEELHESARSNEEEIKKVRKTNKISEVVVDPNSMLAKLTCNFMKGSKSLKLSVEFPSRLISAEVKKITQHVPHKILFYSLLNVEPQILLIFKPLKKNVTIEKYFSERRTKVELEGENLKTKDFQLLHLKNRAVEFRFDLKFTFSRRHMIIVIVIVDDLVVMYQHMFEKYATKFLKVVYDIILSIRIEKIDV